MSCPPSCGGGESPGGGRMGSYYYKNAPRAHPSKKSKSSRQGPAANSTFQVPQTPQRSRAANVTYNLGRPEMNRTYVKADRDMGSPEMNRTYVIPEGPLPGREDLANSIMDDIGDGVVWNETSAMSLSDYQEMSGGEDEDSCPPCDDLDESDLYGQSMNIANETPPRFNISDETQPSFFDESSCPPCDEEDSLGIMDSGEMQDSLDISALAEAPSNISVYDAEELNITTAPRNADWDIPRNRIWQTISSSLDETEEEEEEQYMQFIQGIQNQRREFLHS